MIGLAPSPRLIAGLALTAIALLASSAAESHAASCDLTFANPGLVDSAGFEWNLEQTSRVNDAIHMGTSRSDAFDAGGRLLVSTNPALGFSEYTNPDTSGCVMEDDGREIAYPADTGSIPGLSIRRKIYVPSAGTGFARTLDVFENTSGSAISVTMRFSSNMGSDGFTGVDETSSGDAVIGSADRWATTSHTDPNELDPPVAHVWDQARGAPVDTSDLAGQFAGEDPTNAVSVENVTAEYQGVVIPAGATFAYMHLLAARLDRPGTRAAAAQLGTGPGEVFTGLSDPEIRALRNWTPDGDGDGRIDGNDNCAAVANGDQADLDGDGAGDACDGDDDGDGLSDAVEATIGTNPRAGDSDLDGRADGADACPTRASASADGCPPAPDPGPNEPPPADPGPAPDRLPPRFAISGTPATTTRAALLRRGVSGTLTPNEPVRFDVQLLASLRRIRAATAGDLVLAQTSITLAGGARTFAVRVPKRLRGAVGRRATLRLRVTAIDAAGNRTTRTRRIKVR